MSITTDFSSLGNRLRELKGEQRSDDPICEVCESGGWEMYSTGHMDPHFRLCPACGNPEDRACP